MSSLVTDGPVLEYKSKLMEILASALLGSCVEHYLAAQKRLCRYGGRIARYSGTPTLRTDEDLLIIMSWAVESTRGLWRCTR